MECHDIRRVFHVVHHKVSRIRQTTCLEIRMLYIFLGISITQAYTDKKGKDVVQGEFRKQCDVFRRNKVDLVLGEVL